MAVDVNKQLVEELRRISILLALNLTEGQTQQEQIKILDRVGFQPKEIAKILETTPNTVSVALTRIRKGKRGEPTVEAERGHDNE